ncbi:DMT family transporter [Lysobacter korlensis]|uniref:DMT family transporter n=1 Tax=Lysobacter korlensis TaxID=553636 RepID=A0ABV6RN08_9GAMM
MKPVSRGAAVLCLVGATAFWAGNYVIGEAVVDVIDPLSLTLLRWAIAVVPLVLLAHFIEHPDWRAALRRWPLLLVLALLGMAAFPLALYEALRHTTAVNASLISAVNPALITLVAVLVLRELLGWRGWSGIALSLVGVVIVILAGSGSTLTAVEVNLGDLLMLVSIAVWTAYTILGRRLHGVPPITATAIQAGMTVAGLTPVAAVNGISLPTEAPSVWALLFIGIFPSVGAYLLWNLALRTVQASTGGVFLNLMTVFIVAAGLLLGTPIGGMQVLGGLLVLGGVILTARDRPRAPVPAA